MRIRPFLQIQSQITFKEATIVNLLSSCLQVKCLKQVEVLKPEVKYDKLL